MFNLRNVVAAAALLSVVPAIAHRLEIKNDNPGTYFMDGCCAYRSNIRIIPGKYAQDLIDKEAVHGHTLRELHGYRIEPGKSKKVGSRDKYPVWFVYEKVGKNSYKLIAKIEQTGGIGQDIFVTVTELKNGIFTVPATSKLLKVTTQ